MRKKSRFVPSPAASRWRVGRAALVLATLAAFGASAMAARLDCAGLSGQTIGGASIVATTDVAATPTLAAYCKVQGLIAPKLNFELRLPVDWKRQAPLRRRGRLQRQHPAGRSPRR